MEGNFESEKLFYQYSPEHIPQPFGWGAYAMKPDEYFFLARFHDMVEESPDIEEFITAIVDIHKKSMGKSPNGQYGFHVETKLPFITKDNMWQPTWEASFSLILARALFDEEKTHGKDEELERIKKGLFEKVIPRLLRPLAKTIKPCLLHRDLWPGNVKPDIDSGKLMIFDSCATWGHHEWDLGGFRAARNKLGELYVKEYQFQMGISEPHEEFDDRNALYSL